MKSFLEGWFAPLCILALLIVNIGQETYNTQVLFRVGTLIYTLLFIRKSILRTYQKSTQLSSKIFSTVMLLISLGLCIGGFNALFKLDFLPNTLYYSLTMFVLAVDLSEQQFAKFQQYINPALSFVGTFAGIILIGALLLMLPNAAHQETTFIDALFTSTSAVCVTGLAVVDTGKHFTVLGQTIIMLLIQVGGLGVLAFTNLFGLLFKGQKTFRDIIFISDLVSADNLQSAFSSLIKIFLFVFALEGLGALFIYSFVPEKGVFFAVFHAISAFCNAGFSTLSNSLYEYEVRFNYPLHIVVALLLMIGGLGYNVFFNVFSIYKYKLLNTLYRNFPHVFRKPTKPLVRWDLNTTLVLWTTLILVIVGAATFFIFEYKNTLVEHEFWGKIVTSFFGGVTPRTAGFNSVDNTKITNATAMIYLLLMWIGASPGSTGGGIKTTTFALASLNLWNQIMGREYLIVRYRTVPPQIIARIMAIISLSLIAIGLAVCIMISSQPELDVLRAAFEAFSAYATVGLSMGITAQLSVLNKVVIILLMFLGRVSFLTFLVSFFSTIFPQRRTKALSYPDARIFVN